MEKILVFIISLFLISCHRYKSTIFEEFSSVNQDSVVNINGRLDCKKGKLIYADAPIFDYTSGVHGMCDDVFDTIYTIQLETLDSCIIGNITQIEIVNDTIYIRDQYMTKNICVFDKNGKFVRKIGTIGQGPFEFIEPSDMQVTDNAILIYDQWQHKLIKYKHDGTKIFEKILPFMCSQVVELKNGEFLFMGINADNFHLPQILNYKFWKTDTSFIINKIGLPCIHNKYPTDIGYKINNNSNSCYYYDFISDTVFFFDDKGDMHPKYKINFQKSHSKEILCSKSMSKAINNGKYVMIRKIFPIVPNGLVYTMLTKHRMTNVFCNVKTGETKYFNINDVYKSNLTRLLSYFEPLNVYKDYIVFSAHTDDILKQYEFAIQQKSWWDNAPNWVQTNDKKLIENIKLEDNPIIVFGRVKKEFYE